MKPLSMLPQPAAETPATTSDTSGLVAYAAKTEALAPAIMDNFRTVFDPEIPVNIV